jgi:hypothetical protein
MLLKSNGGTFSNVDMDYCMELWKRLTYEISQMLHYAIDMVLDLTMDWHWLYMVIWFYFMVEVMFIGLSRTWNWMGPYEEATCIYCMSFQTSLPLVTLALLHCWLWSSVFPRLARENSIDSPLKRFSHGYGSELSTHDGLSVLWTKWWLSDAWILCVLEIFDCV